MPLIVYDKIKPEKDGDAIMDAQDVDVDGETLLNFIPIILTQEEYNTLVDGGTITLNGRELTYEENRIYMIKRFVAEGV
jgi:hypothetical protein